MAVILLSLLSCLTTCLGVAVALALSESTRAIAAGIGFAVGLMVLIALVELLPEAVADTDPAIALATATLGAGLVWSAHLVIPHFHLFEETGMTALVRHEPAVFDKPSGALRRARGRAGGGHRDQGASHQARDEGQTRSDATCVSSTEARTCCCTAASRASARWVSRWSWTAR